MIVNIQARHFDLTPELKSYVESKIRLMMSRYKNKIIKISVSLSDVNGPKGGEDRCCKIVINPENIPSIVVQETAASMVEAVNICTHRAKRIVNRNLSLTAWKRKKLTLNEQLDDEDISEL
ncbi:MAG: ribosomal subunit interface protein [Porticoccus sp.]|jgi:ribosomal subunit interface protein